MKLFLLQKTVACNSDAPKKCSSAILSPSTSTEKPDTRSNDVLFRAPEEEHNSVSDKEERKSRRHFENSDKKIEPANFSFFHRETPKPKNNETEMQNKVKNPFFEHFEKNIKPVKSLAKQTHSLTNSNDHEYEYEYEYEYEDEEDDEKSNKSNILLPLSTSKAKGSPESNDLSRQNRHANHLSSPVSSHLPLINPTGFHSYNSRLSPRSRPTPTSHRTPVYIPSKSRPARIIPPHPSLSSPRSPVYHGPPLPQGFHDSQSHPPPPPPSVVLHPIPSHLSSNRLKPRPTPTPLPPYPQVFHPGNSHPPNPSQQIIISSTPNPVGQQHRIPSASGFSNVQRPILGSNPNTHPFASHNLHDTRLSISSHDDRKFFASHAISSSPLPGIHYANSQQYSHPYASSQSFQPTSGLHEYSRPISPQSTFQTSDPYRPTSASQPNIQSINRRPIVSSERFPSLADPRRPISSSISSSQLTRPFSTISSVSELHERPLTSSNPTILQTSLLSNRPLSSGLSSLHSGTDFTTPTTLLGIRGSTPNSQGGIGSSLRPISPSDRFSQSHELTRPFSTSSTGFGDIGRPILSSTPNSPHHGSQSPHSTAFLSNEKPSSAVTSIRNRNPGSRRRPSRPPTRVDQIDDNRYSPISSSTIDPLLNTDNSLSTPVSSSRIPQSQNSVSNSRRRPASHKIRQRIKDNAQTQNSFDRRPLTSSDINRRPSTRTRTASPSRLPPSSSTKPSPHDERVVSGAGFSTTRTAALYDDNELDYEYYDESEYYDYEDERENSPPPKKINKFRPPSTKLDYYDYDYQEEKSSSHLTTSIPEYTSSTESDNRIRTRKRRPSLRTTTAPSITTRRPLARRPSIRDRFPKLRSRTTTITPEVDNSEHIIPTEAPLDELPTTFSPTSSIPATTRPTKKTRPSIRDRLKKLKKLRESSSRGKLGRSRNKDEQERISEEITSPPRPSSGRQKPGRNSNSLRESLNLPNRKWRPKSKREPANAESQEKSLDESLQPEEFEHETGGTVEQSDASSTIIKEDSSSPTSESETLVQSESQLQNVSEETDKRVGPFGGAMRKRPLDPKVRARFREFLKKRRKNLGERFKGANAGKSFDSVPTESHNDRVSEVTEETSPNSTAEDNFNDTFENGPESRSHPTVSIVEDDTAIHETLDNEMVFNDDHDIENNSHDNAEFNNKETNPSLTNIQETGELPSLSIRKDNYDDHLEEEIYQTDETRHSEHSSNPPPPSRLLRTRQNISQNSDSDPKIELKHLKSSRTRSKARGSLSKAISKSSVLATSETVQESKFHENITHENPEKGIPTTPHISIADQAKNVEGKQEALKIRSTPIVEVDSEHPSKPTHRVAKPVFNFDLNFSKPLKSKKHFISASDYEDKLDVSPVTLVPFTMSTGEPVLPLQKLLPLHK